MRYVLRGRDAGRVDRRLTALAAALAAAGAALIAAPAQNPPPLGVEITSPLGRTGLSGPIRIVARVTAKMDAKEAWNAEMCEHGYGAGNPLKPSFVIGKLAESLGPLYRKMAYLAAKGELDALDPKVCAVDPEGAPDFEAIAPPPATCGTSTLFVP